MSNPIRIESLGDIRQLAQQHQEAADNLRNAPRHHEQIHSFLGALGPIFGGFRATTTQLLDQRRQSYEQQANDHEALADGLHDAARQWDTHQADVVQQMQSVHDC